MSYRYDVKKVDIMVIRKTVFETVTNTEQGYGYDIVSAQEHICNVFRLKIEK